MSFTDRFIKVPVKIYDVKEAELTGKENYVEMSMKILPFEISHYKPTAEAGSDKFIHTYVNMKNGDGFYIYMTFDKFEELLNKHQQ